MTKARLIYKNLWRNGTILTNSSEHPQFPVEMTQDDIKTLPWRSRYGTGTGNGPFIVATNLITDGGMEVWTSATNLTNWTEVLTGTSTVNREATVKTGGAYSCRIDIDAGNDYAYIGSSVITLVAEGNYNFTFWYKTATAKTAAFLLQNTGGNVSLNINGVWGTVAWVVLPTATTWTKITISFLAHPSYTTYSFSFGSGSAFGATSASNSVYIDDAVILPYGAAGKYIDFDEGGGELTATLIVGTYTAIELCLEIENKMDTAGGTYTISYSETTGKFTISSGSNFTLRWLTGTHAADNVADLIGFDKTANDTGTLTYTGDYVRIHTSENMVNDFGSAYQYDFIALLNHNLTATSALIIKGADDAAMTTNVVSDTITYNANNLFQFLGTARTKRYCQAFIIDKDNPSMYVQIGVIFIGKYFEPNRSFGPYSEGEIDSTEMEYSPSMNMFTVQERPKLVNRELKFSGLDTSSVGSVRLLLNECGISKAFVLVTDYNSPNSYSYWVHLKETTPPEFSQFSYWTWACPIEEVL